MVLRPCESHWHTAAHMLAQWLSAGRQIWTPAADDIFVTNKIKSACDKQNSDVIMWESITFKCYKWLVHCFSISLQRSKTNVICRKCRGERHDDDVIVCDNPLNGRDKHEQREIRELNEGSWGRIELVCLKLAFSQNKTFHIFKYHL